MNELDSMMNVVGVDLQENQPANRLISGERRAHDRERFRYRAVLPTTRYHNKEAFHNQEHHILLCVWVGNEIKRNT